MAGSFFGFNTNLSAMDEGEQKSEDEYDLLNDETFGETTEGDWEHQHETFAKFTESSRKSKDDDLDLEASLSNLALDDCIITSFTDNDDSAVDLDPKVWASPEKPITTPVSQRVSHHLCTLEEIERNMIRHPAPMAPPGGPPHRHPPMQPPPPHHTMLGTNMAPSGPLGNMPHPPPQNMVRHYSTMQPPPRFPPGIARPPLHQMGPHGPIRMLPPPHIPPPHLMPNNMSYPPTYMPPNFARPGVNIPPHDLSQTYPNSSFKQRSMPFPPPQSGPPPGLQNHPLPPPNSQQTASNMVQMIQQNHPVLNQLNRYNQQHNIRQYNQQHNGYQNSNQTFNQVQQQQQQTNMHYNNYNNGQFNKHLNGTGEAYDEYDNLMSNREKQWLITIQMMQLNTGTPYIDDYYYTVFTERQTNTKGQHETVAHKDNAFNHPLIQNKQQTNRFNYNMGNNRNDGQNRQRRNSENSNRDKEQAQQRTYTPLQFENSLGKLQCGSVTAPRKIIDMDVVSTDKDNSPLISGEAKKSRQLLLTIEALYRKLLKLEDMSNPLAIATAKLVKDREEKLAEQRAEEADSVPTAEIILAPQQAEDRDDLIGYLLTGLEKPGIMGVRKGKVLLLRVLPHLSFDTHRTKLLDFYGRVIRNLPLLGRKDQLSDNLLPRFYSHFKILLGSLDFSDLVVLSDSFVEIGDKGIGYCISNKFGVSLLAALIFRSEELMGTSELLLNQETQFNNWSLFIQTVAKALQLISHSSCQPLEFIDRDVLYRHLNRIIELKNDTIKLTLFERIFVCLEQREN